MPGIRTMSMKDELRWLVRQRRYIRQRILHGHLDIADYVQAHRDLFENETSLIRLRRAIRTMKPDNKHNEKQLPLISSEFNIIEILTRRINESGTYSDAEKARSLLILDRVKQHIIRKEICEVTHAEEKDIEQHQPPEDAREFCQCGHTLAKHCNPLTGCGTGCMACTCPEFCTGKKVSNG